MLISILAAAAAFAAPSAAPPAKKPLETRAFGDRKGLLLIVHGNSALWSDGTRFRPLPTRRFSHTLEALELAFEDPRITGGDASFKDGELTCGAEKRKLPELPQTDARYLYSDAHIKAAGEGPTKPALLGMIGDTQEYVYVEGTEPADPNVRRTPRFQMYTGPAGKLVTKPTYASPGTR
ncbi:MAG: hypothetical protein HY075_16275 [Deltaproteobacteria bacterium]|nr:hypothetical protein [Deltaproteobacteria bacterium]